MRYRDILNEAARIDLTRYGGWIMPDNSVHYVEREEHAAFAETSIEDAIEGGWVRFVALMSGLGLHGNLEALKHSQPVWFPLLRTVHELRIDVADYERWNCLAAYRFELPRDRSAIIELLGLVQ